ncbi:hypothetical protein CAPTEDRAFT_190961 [Capitella teleta]|uniref:Tesmin/TSO1-like CXC domain-containing protein n=1 Tax=Capitella teleta TaxID=283909 RepID=R7TJW7_CAPTE|nr:hypothetical protein CAPTEDRAFT_190961 [Capitella teleta]|eukprot:ELT93782.1 hypothetical protein CAPTEDRAFT_190961 [Capitella teleta]
MMGILHQFLRAKRSGDWKLHLSSLSSMLPCLASSGHNLYTKSLHLYLQKMATLEEEHPCIYDQFMNGLHVVRRSERSWCGISTDLAIEQCLMRAMKSQANNTRRFHQHASSGMPQTLKSYLRERSPFAPEPTRLRNISTGLVASENVNVDCAQAIGHKILAKMNGTNVQTYVFKRADQANTMITKSSQRNKDLAIVIQSEVMFQRYMLGAQSMESPAEAFKRLFKEADIFLDPTANINDVRQAGESAMAIVFGAKSRTSSNDLRYQLLCKKIARKNKYVQPCTLPPTSAASKFHSDRVYLQVQQWRKNESLSPCEWGWKIVDSVMPIMTDVPAAPAVLLSMICYSCQGDCSTLRCSCRKNGLECTTACSECRGNSCSNNVALDIDDDDDYLSDS